MEKTYNLPWGTICCN